MTTCLYHLKTQPLTDVYKRQAVDTFIGMVGERSMCEEGVP